MTKKHFKAVAEAMATARPLSGGADHLRWLEAVGKLSDFFKANNPRFDRSKFVNACHGE